jgi:hypothetical protein
MRRLAFLTVGPLACAVLVLGLAACGDDDAGTTTPPTVTVAPDGTDPAIQGVTLYDIGDYTHVRIGVPVIYADQPPVGGTHWVAPGWADCGFYDQALPNETAVHTMEHGVVWVAYRPDLAAADVQLLRELVRTAERLVVSPFPNLRAPLVATAWGAQLDLQQAGDGRLVQFIVEYSNGERAPERGATCSNGEGSDARPVDLD